MEFRKAQPQDLMEVFAVYQSAINHMQQNGIDQWDDVYPSYDILKADIESGTMYLGEEGKTIAAAFVLSGQQEEEYETGAWQYTDLVFQVIHRLCVNPAFQNKGVGTQVVKFIEKTLKEQGVGAIRLDAFTQNPPALRLYEKMGYSRVGQVNFCKGLFVLFEKKL